MAKIVWDDDEDSEKDKTPLENGMHFRCLDYNTLNVLCRVDGKWILVNVCTGGYSYWGSSPIEVVQDILDRDFVLVKVESLQVLR